ncbi:MAG TPA: hypothetical protein VM942_05215 [Acidimicrobiales bacterium]|nr:hypothetical protein [Acidimicrobiales bacterium]
MAVARLAVIVALTTLVGCAPRGPAARMGSGVLATTTTTIPVDAALEDIVAGAGMTELGRRLFLDASPTVEDADALGRSCAEVDTATDPEGTHTFGCLIAGRIHLRSFPHPEVRDLVYVVAAHELLHVVYGRLTRSERLVLEPELEAARLGNDLLEERLEVYAEVAEDTPNEVHSLLGTEFGGLSPVLESHYDRYFDRARVLEVFRRTLGDREDEIRALKGSVEAMEAQLDAIQAELDRQEAAGDFEGYNANVTRFNALVAEHNATVRQVNALVDEDNRLTG